MQSQNRSRCRESVLGVKSIRAFWIKIPTIPQTSQPRKQLAEDSSKGKAEDETEDGEISVGESDVNKGNGRTRSDSKKQIKTG